MSARAKNYYITFIFSFGLEFLVPKIITTISYYRTKEENYTQEHLIEMFRGSYWSIGVRYQDIMKPLFQALFFSSTLPHLVIICCLRISIQYWIDKHNLLRCYRTPPRYDDKLAVVVIYYFLPWFIVFHLGVGCIVYYTQDPMTMSWIPYLVLLVLVFSFYLLSIWRNLASLCKLTERPYARNAVNHFYKDEPYSSIAGIDKFEPPLKQD